MHRTWLEINSSALLHNVQEFFGLVGESTHLMAVVKSNAYGHGLAQVAKLLGNFQFPNHNFQSNPNDQIQKLWFGVDSIDEALALRNAGITKPILTLGYVPLDRLHEAIGHDIRLTVYNKETIDVLGKIPMGSNPSFTSPYDKGRMGGVKLHTPYFPILFQWQ